MQPLEEGARDLFLKYSFLTIPFMFFYDNKNEVINAKDMMYETFRHTGTMAKLNIIYKVMSKHI